MISLDSIYFQAGSRVQCAARAVNSNGDEGLELSSPIVSISMEEGQATCKLPDHFYTVLQELEVEKYTSLQVVIVLYLLAISAMLSIIIGFF